MPDCFWIDEVGCFETCGVLPALPDGWIDFHSKPDATNGRGIITSTYEWATRAKPAYGNGQIVIAVNYSIGVTGGGSGSQDTYGVIVSDDDGLTYGAFIDKYPWLPGAGVFDKGYDANWSYWDDFHFGTKISFDGTNFYIVEQSLNDASDYDVVIKVSKSSDGENWTTITDAGANHAILQSDSYNGNVWYLGNNIPIHESSGYVTTEAMAVGHTSDDGDNWTTVEFATGDVNWSDYQDQFHSCSANANGLHILVGIVPGANYGAYYYKPTSNTTWAAGVELFDYSTNDYYEDAGAKVLASRVNSSNIYACIPEYGGVNPTVAFRRSTDGGDTWDAEITALALVDSSDWALNVAKNGAEMVELDDGRIVIVAIYEETPGFLTKGKYAVSSDNGATWSTPVVIVQPGDWLDQARTGYLKANHFEINARGNDVMLINTAFDEESRILIFRP